jgi:uncharacterized membrane protein HdeD (DUF308 family)
MLNVITRNWWILLIRGLCAVLFGLVAAAWPGITLFALILMFAVYVLADAVMSIAAGFAGTPDGRVWWPMILVGLLGLIAGVTAIAWPGMTALVLLVVIASWAITHGVIELIAAIRLRKVIDDEWVLVLQGVLWILCGVLMLARPGASALALVLLIGGFAAAAGIMEIALAFRLRRLGHAMPGFQTRAT